MSVLDSGEKRLKLLVVDSSENERIMMKAVFANHHDVICVETVEEGYGLVRSLQPDVVIADHSWNTDGMKLCRQLRKDPVLASIPFVLISSFSRHVGEICHFKAGCDQILYKPFKGGEIHAAIMTAIKRRESADLIHVVYRNGGFDFVTPLELDNLIIKNQIVCFKRDAEVAVISKDPLRRCRQGEYAGPERRQAAFS